MPQCEDSKGRLETEGEPADTPRMNPGENQFSVAIGTSIPCSFSLVTFLACLQLAGTLHAAPGDVDLTFDPGSVANREVYSIVAQPDGKILIGGNFTNVNGTNWNRIARLNTDGSLDTTFNPGAGADGIVVAIVVQTNGRVLVGGSFTNINGTNWNRIARLNADGSLDATFSPGTGANSYVESVAVQADGRILVGGNFTTINGTNRNRIARLNRDGSLDTTFGPGVGANGTVHSVVVQTNAKVLLGGTFSSINGTSRVGIARLNQDGSLDSTFVPDDGWGLYSIAVQPDGKVVVGGSGYHTNIVGRRNADGTRDTTFGPVDIVGYEYNEVWAVGLQTDGKVVIGRLFFTSINGTNRNQFARLNANGSVDTTFDPGTGPSGSIYAIAMQRDGNVAVAGVFSAFSGAARRNLVRVLGDPNDLNIQKTGGLLNQAVLNWTNSNFSLESAPFVTGPYTNVPGAASPHTNSLNGAQQYFRLKLN